MWQELQALEEKCTWNLQSFPARKKPFGCKWVYKIKHNSDDTVERYKARLDFLGNHQVEKLTIVRHSLLLSKLSLFVLFFLLHSRNSKFIKWMFIMHSSMEIFKKIYT